MKVYHLILIIKIINLIIINIKMELKERFNNEKYLDIINEINLLFILD